jgi:hypothetical protein
VKADLTRGAKENEIIFTNFRVEADFAVVIAGELAIFVSTSRIVKSLLFHL